MNYGVVLSMDAVEDVLRITVASGAKAEIIAASRQIQEALRADPAAMGEFLSEDLYFIDRGPLRVFFTIDAELKSVEIVNVRQL